MTQKRIFIVFRRPCEGHEDLSPIIRGSMLMARVQAADLVKVIYKEGHTGYHFSKNGGLNVEYSGSGMYKSRKLLSAGPSPRGGISLYASIKRGCQRRHPLFPLISDWGISA